MGTDAWPVDFRYISSRLTKDIVQQDEATKSRWRPSLTLGLRLFGLSLTKLDIDYGNKFLLCKRAGEAVVGSTGTLVDPGRYVRAEFETALGYFIVHGGWAHEMNVPIAALLTEVEVPGVGRTLIALLGSVSNYTHRKPGNEQLAENPSDVDGLYGLLKASLEPGDPEIDEDMLERDPRHNVLSRVDLVVRLMRDRYEGFEHRLLDVLFKVHYCVDDYEHGESDYDRVIIGAPIWAGTPEPKAVR